ncbi:MAG: hypothetical protein P4K94_05415 [Terracidiphilus sp.]|nr:hypothetical protein [Terracidiphilus sp.]
MHELLLKSGWETAVVAVVFIGILFLSIFGLDAVIGAPKKSGKSHSRAGGKDKDGNPVYSDPDGRQWKRRRKS